jgi:multimeric flavodoxin WrbA
MIWGDLRSHKTSDLLILAAPLYVDTMTAQLKTVMDRSIACMQPFLVKDVAGRIRHPFTWRMPSSFLLLSTSGFPEQENFLPLIAPSGAGGQFQFPSHRRNLHLRINCTANGTGTAENDI